MSDIFSRADTLSKTGSTITHGAFSPTARTRNPLLARHSKTEITLQEMTGQDKTTKWGIEGYRVPVHELQLPTAPKFTMTKESNRRYFDQIVKRSSGLPDPGQYSRTVLWKGKLGVMKGGKRTTFLDEQMKNSSKLPSPDSYSPVKPNKSPRTKFEKAEKISFLSDVRYLGEGVPSPASPAKDYILHKVKSAKIMPLGKPDLKRWKIEKNDLPAFCNSSLEDLDKTFEMVKTSQPKMKFSKSKRILFTDDIIKMHGKSPSPDTYKTIDESKIYKVMAKSRR